jgi:hypothetical protein
MEDEEIVDIERKLVGRVPYAYHLDDGITTLEADSGFGRVGAKMDPKTGALMYEKFEDWITKEKTVRKEIKRSNIRFSDESSAIIDFLESEKAHLGIDSSIRDHSSSGVLSVNNRSEKDRIWDVNVKVHEESGIANLDFNEVDAHEIDPGKRVSRTYGLHLHDPSIAVEEIVSTNQDLPESRVILSGERSHVVFQIGMKNLAPISYNSIVLTKDLPVELKNIIFPGDISEDVKVENGKLIWKASEIRSMEMRVLRYEGDIESPGKDPIPAGNIHLAAKGQDIISNIVVDSFEAMCRNMYFIEADETEEPGEWVCRFVVENTSDFEVEVIRIVVKDSGGGSVFLNLEKADVLVPPGDRWESDSWLVTRSERRSFIKNLVLNVVPGLSKRTNFELMKEGGDLFPAALSFKKSFDKTKVEAKRDTEITAQLVIENTSGADIDHLFIRDRLPSFFLPPSPSMLRVEKGGMEMRDNIGVHVEPDNVDPANEQMFFIRIDDLSQHGGPLARGEKIIIRYTTTIHRPEPEQSLKAPAEVDARTTLPGPVVSARDEAGAPVVQTMQVLRRFSVGKSIEQGKDSGEYHIELLYRNRGNNPVSQLTLRDIIPENFKGNQYSMEPRQEPTPEGVTILEWTVDKVQPGQSIVISYSIKGEGEYHPRDAQIFYNSK